MDATGPVDLPTLWASPEWRAELEDWLYPALAGAGLAVTGALEQDHVRSWSTVLHVETDAGRVWVKENTPSQAFEARLVDTVERLAPGRTPPVVAVQPERGWLATRDLGTPLGSLPDVADEAWTALVTEWADLQRTLEEHEDEVLATGLAAFPEEDAAGWAARVADHLHSLPAEDPRHLTAPERAHVEAGLPLVGAAAAELGALLPAADRLACLHRAVSWGRTMADVPVEVVEPQYLSLDPPMRVVA